MVEGDLGSHGGSRESHSRLGSAELDEGIVELAEPGIAGGHKMMMTPATDIRKAL